MFADSRRRIEPNIDLSQVAAELRALTEFLGPTGLPHTCATLGRRFYAYCGPVAVQSIPAPSGSGRMSADE